MDKTFAEPRPTAVTVIGWAWILMGSLMILSAGSALLMQSVMPPPEPIDESVPLAGIWNYFGVLAVAQVVLAAIGVYAGVQFLRLEAWARTVLEVLTWILLLALAGFAIVWVSNSMAMVGDADSGFATFFAFVGVGMIAVYAAPLGFMLYTLRGAKVRDALG